MNVYKVNLTPYGSMTSIPDSQTLFGSICWAIRDLYGEKELENLLDNFESSKNRFVISSAFIDGIFKAPMIIWATLEELIEIGKRVGVQGSALSRRSKSLKKIEYFTERVFREYLSGKLDRLKVAESIITGEGPYVYKDGVLHYKDEDIKKYGLYEEHTRRNMINRFTGTTTEGGELYYYNRIFLQKGAKLYFLIKTEEIEYFKPVFKIMSDMGIGGDKSVGANNFKVEFAGEFNCEKTIKDNVLLSKYIPNYEEVDWENSLFKIDVGAYRVESRDEFFGEDVFKDEIIYISEGSTIVFKDNKDIYGKMPVVKLLGEKKIRNNGLGFFL